MALSNHQIILLLSCSCIVLSIVPATSYTLSTLCPIRTTPSRKPCNDYNSFQPNLSRYYNPTCTLLYSSNPTGKKRRRRKETTGDDSNNVESGDTAMIDSFNPVRSTVDSTINELPDFDINDDEVVSNSFNAASMKNTGSSASNLKSTVDPLIGTITSNMMASASATNRAVTNTVVSVNDLRDRSLEQKLESLLNEDTTLTEPQVKEELPDLLTLQRERKKVTTEQILLSASSMSKKERQTLARQQQDMEQQSKRAMMNTPPADEDNLFSKLPFITNESGKIEPIKALEAATWTCIIALVLWEVYINSPFFSRAAPIIPIVYDIWI
jgi:hypothetical protein